MLNLNFDYINLKWLIEKTYQMKDVNEKNEVISLFIDKKVKYITQ